LYAALRLIHIDAARTWADADAAAECAATPKRLYCRFIGQRGQSPTPPNAHHRIPACFTLRRPISARRAGFWYDAMRCITPVTARRDAADIDDAASFERTITLSRWLNSPCDSLYASDI